MDSEAPASLYNKAFAAVAASSDESSIIQGNEWVKLFFAPKPMKNITKNTI